MKKNLLVLGIAIITLTSTSIALAFNFNELDCKILCGDVSHKQAKKIINKAIKNGEITEDQVKSHMDQVRRRAHGENMRPDNFGPPNQMQDKPEMRGPDGPDKSYFIKDLEKAGITKEEFEAAQQKGPDAVKQLLDSHGIKPPCPRGNPKMLGPGRLDFSSFIKDMQKAGITKEEFEAAQQKGPDAVAELLKQHCIEKPKR